MDVLVLTVFLSLVLATGFICLFVRHRQAARFESIEREALLPLEEDGPPSGKSTSPRQWQHFPPPRR